MKYYINLNKYNLYEFGRENFNESTNILLNKTSIYFSGPHPKQKIDSVSSTNTVNSDHAMIGSCTPNHCKIRYSRIFKKVSFDGNLVLFLPQRELGMSGRGGNWGILGFPGYLFADRT